jgi:hypothetical protein
MSEVITCRLEIEANQYILKKLLSSKDEWERVFSEKLDILNGDVSAVWIREKRDEEINLYKFETPNPPKGDRLWKLADEAKNIAALNDSLKEEHWCLFENEVFSSKELDMEWWKQRMKEKKNVKGLKLFCLIVKSMYKPHPFLQIQNPEEMKQITLKYVKQIVFSAYGGKGYLIWTRVDGKRITGVNKQIEMITDLKLLNKLNRIVKNLKGKENNLSFNWLKKQKMTVVPFSDDYNYRVPLLEALKEKKYGVLYALNLRSQRHFKLLSQKNEPLLDAKIAQIGDWILMPLNADFIILASLDFYLIAGSNEFLNYFTKGNIEERRQEFKEYAIRFDERWNKNNSFMKKILEKYSQC